MKGFWKIWESTLTRCSLPRMVGVVFPRGSKYPIFEVSGSTNHTLSGSWDQRP